jgi:hypothetical protein
MCVCSLYNDPISSSHYSMSDDGMNNEQYIEKDMKEAVVT